MSTSNSQVENSTPDWSPLYRIGGVAALVQLATVLGLTVIAFTLGLRPTSAAEYFSLWQSNPLAAFLRDDFSSMFMVGMYLFTFPGLFLALWRINPAVTLLATLFTFVAVAVCFATNSGFSLRYLSERHAAATSELERSQLLAAAEAILAGNMWNSSGAYMSGILLQGGGILISLVMLRSPNFSKIGAWGGILGNGFDLAQHLLNPFAPSISAILMMFMGPFYLAWFALMGRDLLRLGRRTVSAKP